MKCKICGHKNHEWDTKTMTWLFEDTEEFITIFKDFYLYACPKCNIVYYTKNEMYYGEF